MDGTYTAPAGIYDTLTANTGNGSFNLKTKAQVLYSFSNWGSTHFLQSMTDENGNTITLNRRAGDGRLLSVADATGRTVTFNYNGNGNITSIVDPLNRTWTIGYDANGNLSSITFPVVSGNTYNMQFGYNANKDITNIRDRRLNTSTYSYNSDNTIQWEQSAAGNRTSFTYGKDLDNVTDASAVTITAPNGVKTTHFYDTYGHLTAVEDALHYSTYYSNFNADNLAQTVQDARGYYHSFSYDGNGNLLSATAPPTPENSSGNKVSFTYNGHNKPTLIQTQLVRKVIITYDASDNVKQVDNYNGSGTLLARTKFTIGAYGLVSDKTDADNHKTLYGYDGNGYLNSVTTPLGRQTQWTYNALGDALSRTDAANVMTTYTLDAWNRVTGVSYSADQYYSHDGQKTYTYDANDNVTGFANAAGSYTRTYDADDRMTEEDMGSAVQVKHVYDLAGQDGLLSQTIDSDNYVTGYSYTGRNELYSVSEFNKTTYYSYDAAGNELTINDPWGNYATKAWDAAGRLQSIVNKLPSGTYLSGYAYLYTQDSQKSKVTETGYNNTSYGVENWGYDGIGHLNSDVRTGGIYAFNASYTVDGVGNRTSQTVNGTSVTWSYDSDDELTSGSNGNQYYYDADGGQNNRMASGVRACPYYTNEGQVAVIYGATPDQRDWFAYDALGRQASRINAAGTYTTYQYDGDNVLTEKQNGSTVTRHQFGTGRLVAFGPGGNEVPQYDGLGSMRQGVDPSTGNVISGADYDGFGNCLTSGSSTVSAYQWQAQSGYRNDGDIGGLIKVGYRYYDPQTGRFTSRDSDITQSAYAYCDGDPINLTDPSGQSPVGITPNQELGLGIFTGSSALLVAGLIFVIPFGGAAIALGYIAVVLAVVAGNLIGGAIVREQHGESPDSTVGLRDPPGHEPEPKGGGNIGASQTTIMYRDWNPTTYQWIGDPYPGPPHGPVEKNPHPPSK